MTVKRKPSTMMISIIHVPTTLDILTTGLRSWTRLLKHPHSQTCFYAIIGGCAFLEPCAEPDLSAIPDQPGADLEKDKAHEDFSCW